MEPREDTGEDAVALRPEFLARMRRRGWPKARAVAEHFRKGGASGSIERQYGRMKAGHPVPARYVESLLDYLSGRGASGATTLADATRRALAPPTRQSEGDWWDHETMAASLAEHFRDGDENYLADPESETREIAGAFFAFLGRMDDPGAEPGAGDAERGAAIRGLGVEEMAAWLRALHAADYRTVMYAVGKGGERVAVSVAVPVGEEVFRRVSGGEMRPEEIGEAEVAACPRHVWIEMLAPVGAGAGMTVAQRSRAEKWPFLYQLAYFSRNARRVPRPFTLVTNPVFGDRLRRFGFRETGGVMKGTSFPVVSVGGSGRRRWDTGDWYQAAKLASLSGPFGMYNRRAWAAE